MRAALLPLVVATATLLVGCSVRTTGTSAPAVRTSASNAGRSDGSQSGSSAAPKVLKPLNADGLTSTPCSSLTTAQLTALGLTNVHGGNDGSVTGVAICGWTDGTTENAITISWQTGLGNGLSTLYSERGQQAYWQPTTVNGYPAVFADFGDQRPMGTCSISVGVSDQLSFISKYLSGPETGAKSCQFAQQAASDVVKNLGGA